MKSVKSSLVSLLMSSTLLIASNVQASMIPSDITVTGSACFGTYCNPDGPVASRTGNITYTGSLDGSSFDQRFDSAATIVTYTSIGQSFNGFVSNASATRSPSLFYASRLEGLQVFFNFEATNSSLTDSYDIGFRYSFFNEVYANLLPGLFNTPPSPALFDAFSSVTSSLSDSNGTFFSSSLEANGLTGNVINGSQPVHGERGGHFDDFGSGTIIRSLAAGESYSFWGSFEIALYNDEYFNFDTTALATADISVTLLGVENTTPSTPTQIPEPSTLLLLVSTVVGLTWRRRRFK